MITVKEELFGNDQVATIKSWLDHPGAALFKRALQNELMKLQIEASNDLLRAEPDKARFEYDAKQKLRRVAELQNTLGQLERAASREFAPFVTKVSTI